ncbi:uncharacterized protein LOC130148852 isoform X1 [Falco biarmicus]|uniref:uncharacterized protein LOC130148852 isoform X1 n=2 Tax=Falco biarmicus TaxID=345155 RepID=UPI0024BCC45E|nr:uncharacterized protein LOC130148852 isoform X1 [Falco biarmicus]
MMTTSFHTVTIQTRTVPSSTPPGEMTLHNYPAAWREHGFEDLGHPGMPSKPGEDHQSKINRAYEPGSDDVIERTTELYNPPSPPAVSGPRDPGKLYTIGAVAAVVSLQVAIVLGYVVVWWRRKKKAPVAGASADQLENGSCPSRPDSQCSCPSRPDSQCSCPSRPDSQCSCPSRPDSQCSCPSRPDSQCSGPSRPDSQCSCPWCSDSQRSCPSRPDSTISWHSYLDSQCSCPSRPDSQSSCPSCPDSWTQQEPLPS